ncbi:MAG: FAD binding domain-containing protein [Spirochaetaceae bacterium]|jgi:CO/xanthine dehydrogenase FAD-binding subunit|nr:FAD binding domain-containing protein [Spirochaetaceae bacterium]
MAEARKAGETANRLFYPVTLQELFTVWERSPGAVISAGATSLSFHRNGGGYKISLPERIISLGNLDELRRFSRTERYLEIGAAVRLDEIIGMGKIVPDVFTSALSAVGSPQLRNLATIGGHICYPFKQLDAVAPLVALDARYELRTASSSRWIPAFRFSSVSGLPSINSQELLTRIRIPLDIWNYSAYKKFTDPYTGDDTAGSMAFVARCQKNILTDIRIVYAGLAALRDRNSESSLTGKQLPLTERDLGNFMGLWADYLSAVDPAPPRNDNSAFGAVRELNALIRAKMLNFIESCIRDLAE